MEKEAFRVHVLGAAPEMFCENPRTGIRAGLGSKGETRPCSPTASFVDKV